MRNLFVFYLIDVLFGFSSIVALDFRKELAAYQSLLRNEV